MRLKCAVGLATLSIIIMNCSEPDLRELATDAEHKRFQHALVLNDLEEVRSVCSENKNFVHSVCKDGFSPLNQVCVVSLVEDCSRPDVARILIDEFGAAVNKQYKDKCNRSPLLEAASGTTNTFSVLIERGGDITLTDCEGSTALHYAVRHGRAETVRILVERGADTKIKNKHGKTPFDELERMAIFNNADEVEQVRGILNSRN